MQVSRMFEIVYLLLEKGSMTAGQLAERFEVSIRTIYRDIDSLAASGIPVYSSRGKGGGIRLMPNFVLSRSLLSQNEQNEILFALQSLKATNASEEEETLARLKSLFQAEDTDWIDVDFSRWGSAEGERRRFLTIKKGILEKRVLSFAYYSTYGERSERKVEPLKLCFKGGSWYLQGFCLLRRGYRTFKVCRMENETLLKENFERRELPLPGLEVDTGTEREPVPVCIRFSSKVAFRVFDEFDHAQIEKMPDGDLIVRTAYPSLDWVYGYLLSFRAEAEILEPESFRRSLYQMSEEINKKYKASSKT